MSQSCYKSQEKLGLFEQKSGKSYGKKFSKICRNSVRGTIRSVSNFCVLSDVFSLSCHLFPKFSKTICNVGNDRA